MYRSRISSVGAFLSSAGLILGSRAAVGAGFQINEHAAAATGRGNSVIATIGDASATFHNPAGLTQTEGTEFQAGVTVISPIANYQGIGIPSANVDGKPVDQSASTQPIPIPHAYVSRALSPKAFVGFGFYAPFGLRIEWNDPDTFVGRTVIAQAELRTFFLTPAIALKLSDMVSVAVGVSLVPATVYLNRALGSTDNAQILFPKVGNPGGTYESEGKVEIAGSAFGVGANAGVQVSLVDHLKLGFTFRSAVDLAFTGKADFQLPNDVPAEIAANFPDGDVDAEITLPHTFGFGIGWVDGPLTLEASTQVTLWNSTDELRINFASGLPASSSVAPRDWKTTPLIRAGAEYRLESAALRAGVGYDFNPIPDATIDPTLPDKDRLYFTLGGGYDFGSVRADLAYMGLFLRSREVEESDNNVNFPPGTWGGGVIHLVALSFGIKI